MIGSKKHKKYRMLKRDDDMPFKADHLQAVKVPLTSRSHNPRLTTSSKLFSQHPHSLFHRSRISHILKNTFVSTAEPSLALNTEAFSFSLKHSNAESRQAA